MSLGLRTSKRAIAIVGLLAIPTLIAGCDSSKKAASVPTPGIDVTGAKARSCRAPSPSGAHPDPVLARVFAVFDDKHTAYTLGWQVVPFRGADHTYEFGKDGNLLALEPAAGGRPLGYGTGNVTIGKTPNTGTLHALIALKSGGALDVSGTWNCG